MNYNDTLDYLFAQLPMFHRIGAAAYKDDLINTHAIMQMLDHPERDFRSIHIAGTNGKGSTSHMLASILQQSGYKTALYTSPHLKDFRERIRINGKMIGKNEVVKFVKKYQNEFEKIEPSFFEWCVGLAFDYFSRNDVDIAVIETGLGGRLDSTNVITPLVSVITNVQKDHMNLLGNTLQKIAKEKAGIIKPKIPVVIGETQGEIATVFKRAASDNHSEIYFADKLFKAKISEEPDPTKGELIVDVNRKGESFMKSLRIDLGGNYQLKNLCTVLQACELLEDRGFELNRKNIRRALGNIKSDTGLSGRWQVLGKQPLVICDTGHNEDGISEVMSQLSKMNYKKLHIVFGMVNDKDSSKILKLLPRHAAYYFCKPDIPRGLDQKQLKSEAEKFQLKGKSYRSVWEAFKAAEKNATVQDIIFVGGSTFVVAEVL
jgi:dihydrofolate synthase / folylpolyglutamate synthase